MLEYQRPPQYKKMTLDPPGTIDDVIRIIGSIYITAEDCWNSPKLANSKAYDTHVLCHNMSQHVASLY